MGELYNISKKKNHVLTGQQNIYYFTQKTLPPSFSRKISHLHWRGSWKHSLFTTFSLVLRVGQVFNSTNKYLFPN